MDMRWSPCESFFFFFFLTHWDFCLCRLMNHFIDVTNTSTLLLGGKIMARKISCRVVFLWTQSSKGGLSVIFYSKVAQLFLQRAPKHVTEQKNKTKKSNREFTRSTSGLKFEHLASLSCPQWIINLELRNLFYYTSNFKILNFCCIKNLVSGNWSWSCFPLIGLPQSTKKNN